MWKLYIYLLKGAYYNHSPNITVHLKTSFDWDDLIFAGSLYHSLGAAMENALSPPQHNFESRISKLFRNLISNYDAKLFLV